MVLVRLIFSSKFLKNTTVVTVQEEGSVQGLTVYYIQFKSTPFPSILFKSLLVNMCIYSLLNNTEVLVFFPSLNCQDIR